MAVKSYVGVNKKRVSILLTYIRPKVGLKGKQLEVRAWTPEGL